VRSPEQMTKEDWRSVYDENEDGYEPTDAQMRYALNLAIERAPEGPLEGE
jgi:hypothetical protein